ncbi:MAG: nucleotide exchange factor GrpE [Candidatus Colwellbacteria bacterium]|nr:nucleotide exchange factor GrpE [Candidatus Colwellbacteria bacterium]
MPEKEKKAGEEKEKDKKGPETEVERLTKERDEYLAGWQRAKADLINYKKEELKRLEEVARFGNADLVLELLSVLDSFDLALVTLKKDEAVEKGIYLIKSRLEDILRKRGLQRIEVKKGEVFNPALHEAVTTVEGGEANTIAEELEAGYLFNDKVLRPTKVRVFK